MAQIKYPLFCTFVLQDVLTECTLPKLYNMTNVTCQIKNGITYERCTNSNLVQIQGRGNGLSFRFSLLLCHPEWQNHEWLEVY